MKFCNHCGRLYEDKCICRKNIKREYVHNNFYDSNGWKSCSRFVRVRDFNLDRLQMYFTKYKPENKTEQNIYNFVMDVNGNPRQFSKRLIVHHVKELESNFSERFNVDNLITLDNTVHEYIHKLYCSDEEDTVKALLFKAIKAELP